MSRAHAAARSKSAAVQVKTAAPDRPQARASPERESNGLWSRLALYVQPKLAVSAPGDPAEQEADRIADTVMRMPEPAVQRKCAACSAGGATCPSCDEEEHVQRKADGASGAGEVGSDFASRLGGGAPLDAESRTFFEPRFGRSFGDVRVHTDAQSAALARSVDARAFALGRNIAFAAGEYVPRSGRGRGLLAHELAHVVQQTGAAARIQRSEDDTDTAKPSDAKPQKVCGPNVTKQLKNAQLKTRKTFGSWNNSRKESACQDLVSIIFGLIAWDIIPLNERDWILANYGSQCASVGATPACIDSIQIDDQCFYAGSVNYAHFGNMFDLCQRYYAKAYPLNNQFTQNEMVRWINFYKGTGITGWGSPSANFKTSVDWAVAGFFNWPSGAATPKGDRANCSATCPLPYTGKDFDVNWSGENF